MYKKQYCVYMMANFNNSVIYTGVTNDLQRRVLEHRNGEGSKFCHRYHVNKLVFYEISNDITAAIAREKQIKGGSRKKKIDLITSCNPKWEDLFEELFGS